MTNTVNDPAIYWVCPIIILDKLVQINQVFHALETYNLIEIKCIFELLLQLIQSLQLFTWADTLWYPWFWEHYYVSNCKKSKSVFEIVTLSIFENSKCWITRLLAAGAPNFYTNCNRKCLVIRIDIRHFRTILMFDLNYRSTKNG